MSNGRDRRGRQKYVCRPCRRSFTENTLSAFSGYRWPRDVIVLAVRWYLAYPLSSRQVLELLAERGVDVSHRTILNGSRRSGRNWQPRYDVGVVGSAGVGSRTKYSCSVRARSLAPSAPRRVTRCRSPGAGPAQHTRVREVAAAIHALGHGLRRHP